MLATNLARRGRKKKEEKDDHPGKYYAALTGPCALDNTTPWSWRLLFTTLCPSLPCDLAILIPGVIMTAALPTWRDSTISTARRSRALSLVQCAVTGWWRRRGMTPSVLLYNSFIGNAAEHCWPTIAPRVLLLLLDLGLMIREMLFV